MAFSLEEVGVAFNEHSKLVYWKNEIEERFRCVKELKSTGFHYVLHEPSALLDAFHRELQSLPLITTNNEEIVFLTPKKKNPH
jgi:hypothetical protein